MSRDRVLTIHPFEARGLGVGPFRCTGMTERRSPNGDGQPWGTCEYCHTGIAFCFHIRSSDGKMFVVGSDCVAKTDRAFDRSRSPEDRKLKAEVERLVRAHKSEQRRARKQVKEVPMYAFVAEMKAALEANPALFTDTLSSASWRAAKGDTRRDDLIWQLSAGGIDYRMKAARAIEAALKGVVFIGKEDI